VTVCRGRRPSRPLSLIARLSDSPLPAACPLPGVQETSTARFRGMAFWSVRDPQRKSIVRRSSQQKGNPQQHNPWKRVVRQWTAGGGRERHEQLIYRWATDTGHLEITGGMGQSDSLASSRRPDGALPAAMGAMDLTEKIGLA